MLNMFVNPKEFNTFQSHFSPVGGAVRMSADLQR